MTKDEAMKLALEKAYQLGQKLCEPGEGPYHDKLVAQELDELIEQTFEKSCIDCQITKPCSVKGKTFKACGAYVPPAAQPAKQERPQTCGTGFCSCGECMMRAKQCEPVATARFDGTLHWVEPYGVGLHRIQGPLYTTPQQSTWVGLTLEDQKILADSAASNNWNDWQIMDAIEAKLKAKNFA